MGLYEIAARGRWPGTIHGDRSPGADRAVSHNPIMDLHALIVGVEKYRDPMISPVAFAQADARDWGDLLRKHCGFEHVRVLAGLPGSEDEPTQARVFDALYEFSGSVREGDHFVLIFGGHGLEVNGEGYLLLSDCRSYSKSLGSLTLQALRRDFLEKMPARWCTMILDSCRDDPDAARGGGANGQAPGPNFYRDLGGLGVHRRRDGRTTSVLSACQPGQRAHGSARFGRGVCSHFLHEGIRGGAWAGGRLTLRELARYAHDRVVQWAATEPGVHESQEPLFEQWGTGEEVVLAKADVIEAMPDKAESVEPLPEGAFAWFHGVPSHLSHLSRRCSATVQVGEVRIEWPGAAGLIRNGVAEARVFRGCLVAKASLESLLAGRQTELLRRWLARLPLLDADAQAVQAFLVGDMDEMDRQVERVRDPVRRLVLGTLLRRESGLEEVGRTAPAIRRAWSEGGYRGGVCRLVSRAYGKGHRVEDWFRSWMMRTPRSALLAGDWLRRAQEAGDSLGMNPVVERFGNEVRWLARTTREHLGAAEILARHLGAVGLARVSMQEAEVRTRSSADWADCAVAWQELFGEVIPAVRCATRAEASGRSARDWVEVARARMATQSGSEPVREALMRAREASRTTLDWKTVAAAWLGWVGDRKESERAMDMAERAASEAADWFLAGATWDSVLGSREDAMRCLEMGLSMATSSFDWQAGARAASGVGVDLDQVRDCLERAAQLATGTADWCGAAEGCRTLLGDEVTALEWAGEALRHAVTVDDALRCARIAGGPSMVEMTMERAEAMAEGSLMWCRCAEGWLRQGRNLERARRALEVAERRARNSDDWGECARHWDLLFADRSGQRRCEVRAGVEDAPGGYGSTLMTVIHTSESKPVLDPSE